MDGRDAFNSRAEVHQGKTEERPDMGADEHKVAGYVSGAVSERARWDDGACVCVPTCVFGLGS